MLVNGAQDINKYANVVLVEEGFTMSISSQWKITKMQYGFMFTTITYGTPFTNMD